MATSYRGGDQERGVKTRWWEWGCPLDCGDMRDFFFILSVSVVVLFFEDTMQT